MSTLIMPSDYGIDMLVGSSPVLSSGFLVGSPYYPEFGRCGNGWSSSANNCALSEAITTKARPLSCSSYGFSSFSNFTDRPPIVTTASITTLARNGSFRSSTRSSTRRRKNATYEPPPLLHLKPCLMAPRTEEEQLCNSDGVVSPSREKKKVSFADSSGQSLEIVKLILEKPDSPPKWTQEFYEKVTGGASTEIDISRWELTFAQPSSNYMNWKAKLERNNISLENAYIQDKENKVTGLVKVKNMAFHKEVKIRFTNNNWLNYEEVDAIFASMPNATATYNIYDSFIFKFDLPRSTSMHKVEFCVQYITEGKEFWDNNGGKNYAIVSIRPRDKQSPENSKLMDAYKLTMEHWSMFSNWDCDLNERYY